MRWLSAVILAGSAAVWSLGGELDRPLKIRFRLQDSVVISGEMTSWDEEGFDGSFGRRLWIDLQAEDVWKIRRDLIDRKDASAWISIGRILLQTKGGDDLAERAFKQAQQISPDAAEAIAQARADAASDIRKRRDAGRTATDSRLRSGSPEEEVWPGGPWPVLSPEEQIKAKASVKSDVESWLTALSLNPEPVESDYFVIYSEQDRGDSVALGTRLDAAYRKIVTLLGADPEKNVFWGKAAVLVVKDPDKYRVLEATAFNQLVTSDTIGLAQYVGPKVFLSFRIHDDPLEFQDALIRELAHGILHRHISAVRLPPWANEGFATFAAATCSKHSLVDADRRAPALAYLRSHQSLPQLLQRAYDDENWKGPDDSTINVGYLVVNLMIREQPMQFGSWVAAVKNGKDWLKAIEEDFHTNVNQFVDVVLRHYRVND